MEVLGAPELRFTVSMDTGREGAGRYGERRRGTSFSLSDSEEEEEEEDEDEEALKSSGSAGWDVREKTSW